MLDISVRVVHYLHEHVVLLVAFPVPSLLFYFNNINCHENVVYDAWPLKPVKEN